MFVDTLHCTVHEFEKRDYEDRTGYATFCQQIVELDSYFLKRFIFSDEYIFQVDGKVHKHNVRNWRFESSHEISEDTCGSEKVAV